MGTPMGTPYASLKIHIFWKKNVLGFRGFTFQCVVVVDSKQLILAPLLKADLTRGSDLNVGQTWSVLTCGSNLTRMSRPRDELVGASHKSGRVKGKMTTLRWGLLPPDALRTLVYYIY